MQWVCLDVDCRGRWALHQRASLDDSSTRRHCLAATDSVAVIGLLREIGAGKKTHNTSGRRKPV